VDIDEPAQKPVTPGDLAAAEQVGLAMLPTAFRGVACLCQATASHGIKPGLRIRLWMWLDRAVSTPELKFWFRDAPVDRSIFGGAQIIYTAVPIFMGGVVDPVPERMTRIDGRPAVRVPPAADLRPKPALQPTRCPIVREGISRAGEDALDKAERAILRALHGQQEFTLVRRSYAVGCAVSEGKLPEQLARTASSTSDAGSPISIRPGPGRRLP